MATLATLVIDAIAIVLAALVDSTETMPHIRKHRHTIVVTLAYRHRRAALTFLGDASLFERRVLLMILIAMKALSLGRRHGRVQCGHEAIQSSNR